MTATRLSESIIALAIAVPVAVLATGCESPGGGSTALDAGRGERVMDPPATVVDARPAALVDGRRVQWGQLRPVLSEAAGATALREVILDRKLEEAAAEQGITVSADDIARERRVLIESLHEDPDQALRLLGQLRARQGLGPHRFEALMRRNAKLRAMVRDRVDITDDDVRQMFETIHGPKRQARIITVPSLSEARAVIERVNAGELFADVAVDVSTDESAARGGLLEPISRADASYPEALRSALWHLEPERTSDPVLLDGQYAVLALVRDIEGDEVELEEVRERIERQVRINRERIEMDRVARRLLANVTVTVVDEALKASWQMHRGGRE